MNTQEFSDLQEEFLSIARENLLNKMPCDDEAFSDVLQEVLWQVGDWYEGASYYVKPEDILQDYFFLTAEQAHRFLPIFIENLRGYK